MFPQLIRSQSLFEEVWKPFISYWCGTLNLGKTEATMTHIYIWYLWLLGSTLEG